MRKLLSFLLVAVAAVFIMTACSQQSEEPAQEETTQETTQEETQEAEASTEPIKIGVAGPHSGDLASYGIPTANAVKLYVDEINSNGGVNGRQIELVVEDDVCKPEVAANTAAKLVSEEVVAVVGHICSGATKAALGMYKDAQIPVMSPSATNPALTKSGDYPNFFRTIAPDDSQARLQVDFALDKLGLKKLAVIHDKGDYGKGLAEFAKSFIEQAEGAEVVLYEGVTPGAVDYSAVVQKVKQSEADGVIFGGYHPEASKIVTVMKKKKLEIPFISDDGVKDETFIKVAGDFAEGVYATGPKDVESNPLSQKAINAHVEKYGEKPGAFYLNGYSAIIAFINAIDVADSTEYDAIVNALTTEYVETPVGNISFDKKGDAIGVGFSVYQVQNGEYVELQ
ncbi:branched-chain amino acid ABC transporter substrate-binding protein [Limisalsivibrio acetivorans]|uniref:branched-chain amino acid ABC transporter substrate-binding protein n=1 Tax=Limisalsivibrio acetivorans TaxID=1304888 RepID=UPI0003B43B03|nr:branched-chain amino acid ABC transporter substrate-binding protein [Limisalsivibrio acetivorans]